MAGERRDLVPEFWRELAGRLPRGAVVLDVGAHYLEEACHLIPYLEGVEWHAFEADPACCRGCAEFVVPLLERRGWKVAVRQVAVCDEVGERELYLSERKTGEPWTASSSICRPKNVLAAYPWLHFPRQIRVPSTTLDAYCSSAGIIRVDLLKMDVQGAEISVVRGGQETLKRTRYVVTEVVENEEYEGQVGLDGLVAAMPGRWSVVERLACDALLVNESSG